MTITSEGAAYAPVRRSIHVRTTPERAFAIFTEDLDSWWPRTHHIGGSPMRKAIIECRAGGRCYTEQVDGTECDWGTVLVWDPPHRLVLAWQITHEWGYQPDLAQSSEVEVRFTGDGDGTRVDLDHRHLERHGGGAVQMRTAIDAPNGWSGLLQLFAARIEQTR